MLHTVIHTACSCYLPQHLRFLSEISGRSICSRGSSLLSIPIHGNVICNRFVIVSVSRLWNTIPDSISNIDERSCFGVEDIFHFTTDGSTSSTHCCTCSKWLNFQTDSYWIFETWAKIRYKTHKHIEDKETTQINTSALEIIMLFQDSIDVGCQFRAHR